MLAASRSTSWGWLAAAAAPCWGCWGKGERKGLWKDRGTLRKGQGQMELFLLVPVLLLALKTQLTEVWCWEG